MQVQRLTPTRQSEPVYSAAFYLYADTEGGGGGEHLKLAEVEILVKHGVCVCMSNRGPHCERRAAPAAVFLPIVHFYHLNVIMGAGEGLLTSYRKDISRISDSAERYLLA